MSLISSGHASGHIPIVSAIVTKFRRRPVRRAEIQSCFSCNLLAVFALPVPSSGLAPGEEATKEYKSRDAVSPMSTSSVVVGPTRALRFLARPRYVAAGYLGAEPLLPRPFIFSGSVVTSAAELLVYHELDDVELTRSEQIDYDGADFPANGCRPDRRMTRGDPSPADGDAHRLLAVDIDSDIRWSARLTDRGFHDDPMLARTDWRGGPPAVSLHHHHAVFIN